MKRFLKCPKINRIIEYKAYCVFDCPNRVNVTAYLDEPPLVECLINGKKHSIKAINGDDLEKLINL